MLVVGLIDIQHMQSVIKVFFFFFSKIATILVIWKPGDRETRVKIKLFTIHLKFYGPNGILKNQDWTSNQPYLPEGFNNTWPIDSDWPPNTNCCPLLAIQCQMLSNHYNCLLT